MTRVRFTLPLILTLSHLVALVFGLVGILIMLPHPELWVNDPNAVKVFNWSMEHAGATHIILGAAAMFAYGIATVGWWKTTTFAVVSYTFSLGFELFGTGTGWPFGNYAYTDFLGTKVLGRVPYTIPLSWFYMGFASYLLAANLVSRFWSHRGTWTTIALGAWLLTVWDLVLDPAMAHESLRIQFWVWDESGPYFGMPIKNFIGWSVTGLVFMAASRAIWREDANIRKSSMGVPLIVYTANLVFAMVLSAGVGLWLPIVLAAVLGLVPAAMAVWPERAAPVSRLGWQPDA